MRLTLRTLIAWLDDTLTPSEVRTIGQQVAESPFAKDLVDRVHRVTRQRRLTFPGDGGVESIDPNLVASYLDNALNPEQVADYEKRCLTSDVNLAEVASVHQVLSLIGQKAKVPADARQRMYRLVRGRETTRPATNPRTSIPAPVLKSTGVKPISPWSGDAPGRRSWLERFGAAIGVLTAICLLLWAAAYSLRLDMSPDLAALNRAKAPLPKAVERPVVIAEAPKVAKPDPSPSPVAVVPKMMASVPLDPPTPHEVASFITIQGVVLRSNLETSIWDRVEQKSPINDRTRLVNLSPFRNTLKLGKDEVDLIDSTEVILDRPGGATTASLDLKRGQIVLRTAVGSPPFALRFEGTTFTIAAGTGVGVGIERNPTLIPGQSEPAPAHLRLYVPEGHVILKSPEVEEALDGPGEISLLLTGQFGEKSRQSVPPWVTESSPSGFSKEVGDQFVALLRPGRPILADLVEAMDDPQKDVKRMAVLALGAIGSIEQVVEVVSRKEDPAVHRAGIDVLRAGLALGADSAKAVREALIRQFDQPWAEVTEKLIVGYRIEDVKDEAKIAKLVEYLSLAPSRGTRQLALDNLRILTGRDTLDYDPDNPEGKGLKAWQELVRKKEVSKDSRQPSGAPR